MRAPTAISCLLSLGLLTAPSVLATCTTTPDLSKVVAEFSSKGTSRVGALLQFGESRNLCLGLEYVEPSLLADLVDLHMRNVTVREAISSILGDRTLQIHVDDGIVVITRRALQTEGKSLFDYVLSEFAVRRATVQEISNALYMQLLVQLRPTITGFAGHHPAGDMGDLIGPVTESNRSIRYLLNLIVVQSKGGAWIARVPWKLRAKLQIAEQHSPWTVIEYGLPKTGYGPILDSIATDLRSDLSTSSTFDIRATPTVDGHTRPAEAAPVSARQASAHLLMRRDVTVVYATLNSKHT